MSEMQTDYGHIYTMGSDGPPVPVVPRRRAAPARFVGDARAVWLVSLIMLLATLGLVSMLSGCSSAQVAAAEADVHAVLVNVDAAVITGAQSPEALLALLDTLLAMDPSNATLQSIVAKGKAAIAAGDLATAHGYLSAGITLTGAPKASGT